MLDEIYSGFSKEAELSKPTIVRVYSCKTCEETIKTAPAPAVLLPKAIASANTMAYVSTAKYANGLPLYRLSEILKRHQIVLSHQTLSESALSVAHQIKPLIEHLKQQLFSGPLTVHPQHTASSNCIRQQHKIIIDRLHGVFRIKNNFPKSQSAEL